MPSQTSLSTTNINALNNLLYTNDAPPQQYATNNTTNNANTNKYLRNTNYSTKLNNNTTRPPYPTRGSYRHN